MSTSHSLVKAVSIRFIVLLLTLPSAMPSHAHSELERTEPKPGAMVRPPLTEVAIWFNQKLEPAFSAIAVRNAAGQRIDAGKTSVTGNVMRVPLKPVGAGTYRVNWRVLSVDTHGTQGSFSFEVAP